MIDWSDAFDNSGHVPEAPSMLARWRDEAAAFRETMTAAGRARLDVAYGPGPRNVMDVFDPEAPAKGVLVFVHGGYWRSLDKSVWSHLAGAGLAQGWQVAIPSYTLAPEARIAQITREVADAIALAAGDAAPLRLAGHSAGGHLVARMLCQDSPLEASLRGRIERAVPISGVFDLRPLLLANLNDDLHLDAEEAAAESPALLAPGTEARVTLWVGAAERPEFLRQTRLMAEAWEGAVPGLDEHYEPGHNHFTVVEGLGNPDSPLATALFS